MRIYLCARYGRRLEMTDIARQLIAYGNNIVSSWIYPALEDMDRLATPTQQGEFAAVDLTEIRRADTFICFTECPTDIAHHRGGRHVEFGYALGLGIDCVIIGPRETWFHSLPQVQQWDTWEEFLRSEETEMTDADVLQEMLAVEANNRTHCLCNPDPTVGIDLTNEQVSALDAAIVALREKELKPRRCFTEHDGFRDSSWGGY